MQCSLPLAAAIFIPLAMPSIDGLAWDCTNAPHGRSVTTRCLQHPCEQHLHPHSCIASLLRGASESHVQTRVLAPACHARMDGRADMSLAGRWTVQSCSRWILHRWPELPLIQPEPGDSMTR